MGVTGRKHVRGRQGSILVLVVIMIVILALIGWGMLTLGLQGRVFAAKQSDELIATAAADAGIAKVLSKMNEEIFANGLGSHATEIPPPENPKALGACDATVTYSASACKYDPAYGEYGYHLATSTGRCRLAERTINAILYYESLWRGIGVKEDIDIRVGAEFIAPYGGFRIRTNSVKRSAIKLKAGINIPGDVMVGPDPNLPLEDIIDIKSTTIIKGGSGAAANKIPFPPVRLPVETPAKNPVVWDNRGTYTYVPNTPIIGSDDPCDPNYIRYDSFELQGQTAVQAIQGHCVIYVQGDMRIKNGAEIIIEETVQHPDSTLVLYLGGNLLCDNGAGFTNNAKEIVDGIEVPDYGALKIFGLYTCKTMELKAKGDYFFGYAYAPEADLFIHAKNEVAGAFTGKSLTLLSKVVFTYIPDNGLKEQVPTYVAVRWWEE